MKGTVPGIDKATFDRLADDAKDNCPISAAIRGNVEVSVEAELVDASTAPPASPAATQGIS